MTQLIGQRLKLRYILIFALIFSVGTFGFLVEGCRQDDTGVRAILDAIYRSAQLFLIGFDRSCPADMEFEVGLALNSARFAALLLFFYTAVAVVVPILIHRLTVPWQGREPDRRVVVLGYGPLGQSVAAAINSVQNGMRITAVHRGVNRDLAERALNNGVALIDGDPSDPQVLRQARVDRSKVVIVALADDMKAIDAAVSAKSIAPDSGISVRAIIDDPELTSILPETTSRGFLGAGDVSYFSLPIEAARLLWAEARFDRTALEMGQPRVHLVIIGCGAQGEAIAVETLLSSWRVGLKPPILSIFDLDNLTVRQRMASKAPALFPDLDGDREAPLPAAAKAEIRIHHLDVRAANFSQSGPIAKALQGLSDPTAWIFASPNDALNLEASASLFSQMLRKDLPSAPIRVCVRSGHQNSPLVLVDHPVTIAKAFGSPTETLLGSDICVQDPDRAPRRLHATYLAQSDEIAGKDLQTAKHPDWQDLSETLRAANRRLYRQSVMKIEDLGLQWTARRRSVPVVETSLQEAFVEVENSLDYRLMEVGKPLPQEWWHTPLVNSSDPKSELQWANRIKNIAIVEHNRWIVDRALDGWQLTRRADSKLRDDVRRRHHAMHDWTKLKPHIRRFDAALLRALVIGEAEDRQATAWRKRILTALILPKPAGNKTGLHFEGSLAEENFITELRVILPPNLGYEDSQRVIVDSPTLAELLTSQTGMDRLCRIRFDFFDPPSPGSSAAANALGRSLLARYDRLVESRAEVSSLWRWGRSDQPIVAFSGVRDLARLGGDKGLATFLKCFFARRLATGRLAGLVSGYAPGADRIAISAWNELGFGRSELIFPYKRTAAREKGKLGLTEYLTAKPEEAAFDEVLSETSCEAVGNARVAKRRRGLGAHACQAQDLIEAATVLIVLYDGNHTGLGSVGYTFAEARRRGMKVVAISRFEDEWRSDDPDESDINAELGTE